MIKGYTPSKYEGFEPVFDDGYVTALGLSVANGIERAVNMTMLQAETVKKWGKQLQKANYLYELENAPEQVKKGIPKDLEEMYNQEIEEYQAAIDKRKDNQLVLEKMISDIGDVHNLGTVGRFTTEIAAGMVESINPAEMVVDYLSGGIAGKFVKSLSKTSGLLGKALARNSTRTLMEVGVVGALGGSYDGVMRMYITNDWSMDNFLKSSAYGSLSAIGFYGVARYAKSFGKIKSEKDFKQFGKALRGDADVDPKILRKANNFMSAMQELKKSGLSNYDEVMDTVDRIIDTYFVLGKNISKEDVISMLKLPKHSEQFDAAQRILSLGDNAKTMGDFEINRSTQTLIAMEINEIMSDPVIAKAFDDLGKKRIQLETLSAKKKLGKKQKEKFVKLAEEISELEEKVQIKKLKELNKQMEELKIEHTRIADDLNSKLDGYDIESFMSERYKYDEEMMTIDVDNVAKKLGEDVEHRSVREIDDYEVEDTKVKTKEVEENYSKNKVDTDDAELKQNATEFKDIDDDWNKNLDEKTNLIRQWVEQGCEL